MVEKDLTSVVPLVLVAADRQREDDPFLALLRRRGYVLQLIRSGRHALRRARDGAPDLVVVDVALRDTGALELCRALRADPQAAIGAAIILVSEAPFSRSQRAVAFAAGAWECVGPGAEPEEMLLRIGSFVRAKRLVDEVRRRGLVDPDTGLYNSEGLVRRAREVGAVAFRQPAALSCVVLAVNADPDLPAERAELAIARWSRTLKSESRLSDVIGRLSAREFAIVAPATNADGAVKLAERLATSMEKALSDAGVPDAATRVRAGYEAVENMRYSPAEPLELVARAAAALRTGQPSGVRGRVRRSDPTLRLTSLR